MRQRRGVALLVALVALLLIGALVTATLFRVQSDVRLAREGMARRQAEVAAERALRLAAASTSSATVRALPIGATVASGDRTGGVVTTVSITRIDTALAWLVATAAAPSVRGTARARLGIDAIVASSGSAPLQILAGDVWAPVY